MPSLRFAFASCQQYEQGYYTALRHMAGEDLNAVLFLGDYIYEGRGQRAVRTHDAPEAITWSYSLMASSYLPRPTSVFARWKRVSI